MKIVSFLDAHAGKVAALLVVTGSVVGVAGVRWEARERAEAVAAEAEQRALDIAKGAEERRAEICEESRNLRALVSELIDTAVTGRGGGVRYDEVPSFAGMPLSVQTFLRDYAAAQANGESGPDLAQRLRTFQEERLGDLPEFCRETPP